MVTSYIIIVQCHNGEIDINMIYVPCSDLTSFTCLYVYVCVCVCVCAGSLMPQSPPSLSTQPLATTNLVSVVLSFQ